MFKFIEMKRGRISEMLDLNGRWKSALALFAIGVVTILLYAPSLNYLFVFDDIEVVSNNSFIRNPANLKLIFSREYFEGAGEMSYRPLVTLSYFIDVWAHNATNFGCNLQNLLWLIVCGWLAFYLYKSLGLNLSLSAIAVIIFMVHPSNVEIALAEGHREWLIFLAFALASWLAFVRGANSDHKPFLALALFLWGLSLFALELALVLPFIFALFAWVFLRLRVTKILRLLTSYLVVIIAYIVFLFLFSGRDFGQIGNMSGGMCCSLELVYSYFRSTLLPIKLAPAYDVCYRAISIFRVVFALVVVGVVSLAFIDALVHRKPAALFWAWYVAPALFLFQPIFLPPVGFADRYLCFGLLGLLGLFVLIFGLLRETRILWILIFAIIAVFAIVNFKYQRKWNSHVELWEQAVKVSPYSCIAQYNLGIAYTLKHESGLARKHFLSVTRTCPNWGKAWAYLGAIEEGKNRPRVAKAYYREGLANDPECADCYRSIAVLKMRESDMARARDMLEELVRANPSDRNSWRLLLSAGRLERDNELVGRAIQALMSFNPPDLEAELFLAQSLWTGGEKIKAIGFLIEALKNYPQDGERVMKLYEEMKNR